MAVAQDPVELIRGRLAKWGTAYVELDVFGTEDPAEIVRLVDGFCRRHLRAPLSASLFYTSSVGSTHGVKLADGRELVIKARPPADANPDHHHDARSLDSVCRVLDWLQRHGYPCAPLVLGPTPLAKGIATVEEFFERGERGDPFRPACRKAIATGLAHLIEILRSCGAESAGVRHVRRPAALYPQPHARIFDFPATAPGAEWIDDFARRARQVEDAPSPRVLGHVDWRVEHLRFLDDTIVATYDWDSLGFLAEAQLVGSSAHGFTADWSRPGVRRIPTADDIQSYVAEYEEARGRAFSRHERASIFASCVYALAYGARCQHALEPARREWEPDTFPHLLRTAGDALLAGSTVRA
jgi:hypothetical protein